jgi:hypothetical protein
MSRRKIRINEIGREIKHYLTRSPSIVEIRSDELAVMKVPVHMGHKHFIDVNKMPDPDKLPILPERMREFAARYVIEYRPQREWAKIFNVSRTTIHKWLADPRVQQHIVCTRYEYRMYSMAELLQLSRNATRALNNILTTKINGFTIDAILKTAKFVLQLITDPSSISSREKGLVNLQIGFPGQEKPYESPFKTEFHATDADIKEIERKTEQLENIASELEAEDVQYEVEE